MRGHSEGSRRRPKRWAERGPRSMLCFCPPLKPRTVPAASFASRGGQTCYERAWVDLSDKSNVLPLSFLSVHARTLSPTMPLRARQLGGEGSEWLWISLIVANVQRRDGRLGEHACAAEERLSHGHNSHCGGTSLVSVLCNLPRQLDCTERRVESGAWHAKT